MIFCLGDVTPRWRDSSKIEELICHKNMTSAVTPYPSIISMNVILADRLRAVLLGERELKRHEDQMDAVSVLCGARAAAHLRGNFEKMFIRANWENKHPAFLESISESKKTCAMGQRQLPFWSLNAVMTAVRSMSRRRYWTGWTGSEYRVSGAARPNATTERGPGS